MVSAEDSSSDAAVSASTTTPSSQVEHYQDDDLREEDSDSSDGNSSSSSSRDEEDSEEEEESEEEESSEESEGEVVHYGVLCDECGRSDLRGSYYHSTRIIDYDICEECYKENHERWAMADAFVAIKGRRSYIVEETYFDDIASLRVDVNGWTDLEEELAAKPNVQNLDIDLHYPEEEPPTDTQLRNLSSSISQRTSLKVLHLEFPSRAANLQGRSFTLQKLLQGITDSTSIVTLSIKFDFSWGPTIRDVCHLIRRNTSVRYLILKHMRIQPGSQRDRRWAELIEQDWQARASATPLFQALAEGASVNSFVLKGIGGLPAECRTAAITALRNRPSLKRIKAPFVGNNNNTLVQLMEAKKHRWTRGWNDPGASSQSRVEILQEILSAKQVEEQDQVAALFHFVRSNPGSLPELQQEEGCSS